MKKIIILGYGNIGQLEAEILEDLHPAIYDPKFCKPDTAFLPFNPPLEIKLKDNYDLAIVCVPTPTTDAGYCDISYVEQAIQEVEAEIYLIKSTVAPGTTDYLRKKYNKRIVMSPEHSGTTQHCNDFEYNFTILGGELEDCQYIQQIYQKVFNAYHRFMIVDSKTAELAKYMLNSYLATKVTFCNEFAKFCEAEGISYEKLRECFILDPRIEASHTFVYKDAPYWNSHCFNKDLPAIANLYNSEFLKSVISINNEAKEKCKK